MGTNFRSAAVWELVAKGYDVDKFYFKHEIQQYFGVSWRIMARWVRRENDPLPRVALSGYTRSFYWPDVQAWAIRNGITPKSENELVCNIRKQVKHKRALH